MNNANAETYAMITEEERDEYLHSDVINFMVGHDGEPEWGFSAQCNALYKIDIHNATAEYVSSVPGEKNISLAYLFPMKINNKLFLSPVLSRNFAIFDIDSVKWTKIPIPSYAAPAKNTYPAFGGAIHCGDYLLICPGTSGIFAKYDIASGEFSFHDHWVNEFKPNIVDSNKVLLLGGCFDDTRMYFPSPQCNVVTELNPKDMSFVLHQVGKKTNTYCGITYARDSFWLIKYPASGDYDLCAELVEWRPDTGKYIEHTNLPVTRDKSRTGRAFSHILTSCDDIFLFPWHSDNIIKFDTRTKKSELFKPKPEFNYFDRKGKHSTWGGGVAMPWVRQEGAASYPWKKANFDSSVVYIQSPTDYSLIILNLSTGEYTKKKWRVNGAKYLLAKIDPPDSVPFAPRYETVLYWLSLYLDELVSSELPLLNIEKRDCFHFLHGDAGGLAGKKIYEHVKKMVL